MSLEHRIESKQPYRVVGVKMTTTTENGKGMADIANSWKEILSTGKVTEILPLMNQAPYGLQGISVYNTSAEDAHIFDYYIACASTQPVPDGMSEYTVPAYTWAIFPCKQNNMGEVMTQIVTDWLPSSNYTLVNSGYETGIMKGGAPDIELYDEKDNVEIWIAVTEK